MALLAGFGRTAGRVLLTLERSVPFCQLVVFLRRVFPDPQVGDPISGHPLNQIGTTECQWLIERFGDFLSNMRINAV